MAVKRVLVLGGGGFIGGHLVKRMVARGHWVRSVDLKEHLYGANPTEFILGDLTEREFVRDVIAPSDNEQFDEIYQLAADMGGAGYIFTGENDANVMFNSASINLNVLHELAERTHKLQLKRTKIFYSSSACIYPEGKQLETENPGLCESDAYPANPDSEYGWEKLFSERLYFAFSRNHGLNVRVARFHNIFGPEGTWNGGREKAPAAICRKVAESKNDDEIQIWGDGEQTRSFLYIEECLDAIDRMMLCEFQGPLNIGSERSISINQLVQIAATFEGKRISIKHIPGPLGVRGRNSNNELLRKNLDFDFKQSLEEGLKQTYYWIKSQLESQKVRR
jgi:nucleoside-diphosphate-sugar epimerase